jgi:hypothetical protein
MNTHRHFVLPTWQDKNNTAPIGRLMAVRRSRRPMGGDLVRVSSCGSSERGERMANYFDAPGVTKSPVMDI